MNTPGFVDRTALDIFFHVNKDLTDFQKEVIGMVMDEESGPEEYSEAIRRLNAKVDQLTSAGWSPATDSGDKVLKPQHYERYPIEPTYFIVENSVDWLRGNFLKYVCRFPYKGGVEDLKKAMRYVAMLIQYIDGEKAWSR